MLGHSGMQGTESQGTTEYMNTNEFLIFLFGLISFQYSCSQPLWPAEHWQSTILRFIALSRNTCVRKALIYILKVKFRGALPECFRSSSAPQNTGWEPLLKYKYSIYCIYALTVDLEKLDELIFKVCIGVKVELSPCSVLYCIHHKM